MTRAKSEEARLAEVIAYRAPSVRPELLAYFMGGHGPNVNKILFEVVVSYLNVLASNHDTGLFFDEEERVVCLKAKQLLLALLEPNEAPPDSTVSSEKDLPNPNSIWE